jgi:hypothetical protein
MVTTSDVLGHAAVSGANQPATATCVVTVGGSTADFRNKCATCS